MMSASKMTLSQNNLKIFRPKVTKNCTNLHKKFCESPPRFIQSNVPMILSLQTIEPNEGVENVRLTKQGFLSIQL